MLQKPLYANWRTVIASFLLLFIGALYANWSLVRIKDVLYEPLMDTSNPYYIMTKIVEKSGIDFGRKIPIYIRVPRVSKENLTAVIAFTKNAENFFQAHNADVGVSSISVPYNYHGDVLEPFITNRQLEQQGFNPDTWYTNTIQLKEVAGILVGRIPGEYDFYIVTFEPTQGFDEIEMYRLVKSFLKGEWLTLLDLYISPETEINVKHQTVLVDDVPTVIPFEIDPWSFAMARGDIHFFSVRELVYITLAIIFIGWTPLHLRLIAKGSSKQSLLALVVIVVSLTYTRATIGICDRLLPWHFVDEVFTILTYIVNIIPGFSFCLRRFEAFNHVSHQLKSTKASYWERWRSADAINNNSLGLILFVAVVDFLLCMAALHINGARSMFNVGVIASFGLTYTWFMARTFIPAAYRIIGGHVEEIREIAPSHKWYRMSMAFNGAMRTISTWCAQRIYAKHSILVSCVVLVCLVSTTITGLSLGLLNRNSDPGELLNNMKIGALYHEMQKPGRLGFSPYDVYVSGKLSSTKGFAALWDYQMTIESWDASTKTMSLANYVVGMLEADFAQDMSQHTRLDNALQHIMATHGITEEELLPSIWSGIIQNTPQNLLDNYVAPLNGSDVEAVMLTVLGKGTSAQELRNMRDGIYALSQYYPALYVLLPGPMAIYPEVDAAVSGDGGASSALLSLLMIFCITTTWIAWHNYQNPQALFWISAVRGGICATVPFIVATCSIYLLLMALSIPYDIASSSISSISVAVAVDFPLLYIFRVMLIRLQHAPAEMLLASKSMIQEMEEILVDYVVNTPAFLPLLFSLFPIMNRVGYLMVVALFACVIGTLLIMAPLMRWAIIKKQ